MSNKAQINPEVTQEVLAVTKACCDTVVNVVNDIEAKGKNLHNFIKGIKGEELNQSVIETSKLLDPVVEDFNKFSGELNSLFSDQMEAQNIMAKTTEEIKGRMAQIKKSLAS